jgi:hypothetical protein
MVDWFNPEFLDLMETRGTENRDGVKKILLGG